MKRSVHGAFGRPVSSKEIIGFQSAASPADVRLGNPISGPDNVKTLLIIIGCCCSHRWAIIVSGKCLRIETRFSGLDFGRVLVGSSSESAIRPAEAGRRAEFDAFPIIRPKPCQETRFPPREHMQSYLALKFRERARGARLAMARPTIWDRFLMSTEPTIHFAGGFRMV